MALTKVFNRMIEGGYVHVKDFGAVGDAVNGSGTDDTTAIQTAINNAAGRVVRLEDGASYLISSTLDLTGIRGFVGAASIYWGGALNGVMFDASKNSGIIIDGGVGEMIVRADTPVRAEIAFKMGGTVGYTTFQSALHKVNIFGDTRNDPSNQTIAVDGGPSASNALNDGEFHHVRIDGFDIGYRLGAPDHKIFGGTCRLEYTSANSYGSAISLENNGRVQAHGWVVSEAKTPIRSTHGTWGASFYGCWFEGIVSSMASVAPSGSEIIEGLSFYNCLFSTNSPASYLFDLQEWQPSAVGVANHGQLRLFGCTISSVSNNSNIRLHSNSSYNPLSVQIYGMQNSVPSKALTFSGFTNQVFWQENGSLKIGNTSGGIARHFTTYGTLTFPSIAAGAREGATISVSGVRLSGDEASVIATPVSGIFQDGLVFVTARVSADDTVQVILQNTTGGAITPTALSWRIEVFTH